MGRHFSPLQGPCAQPFWSSRRALLAAAAGAAAAPALSACANSQIVGFDKQAKSLDICNNAEPDSLDPQMCVASYENNIVGNMFVGLLTEDAHSHPIPGMAESYQISDDGLTWTFLLRRAQWSDGMPCNAHDFQFSYRRLLDAQSLSTYASLLYPIKNAEAVNSGRLPVEDLGVTAIDDLTLEIKLEHPAPYLAQLMKHYITLPVPKHVVLKHGDEWVHPDNIVVNGPYTLKRWWANYIVHLERNPKFFDAANVMLDNLYFYPSNDANAAARKVMSGEAGWSTRFASNQVADLRKALPGYVRIAPFLVCNYFSLNCTRPPFNDVRVRQALAMSYDRDFVANQIYRTGERPAYALVPPGIANYPGAARYPWAGQSMDQRRAQALQLLRAAGYGPSNPLRFELSFLATSDNPRVAVVAQADWRSLAPWVIVELHSFEAQIHYANLQERNYQIGSAAWVADFNDARNFLYLLETRSGPQNTPGYSNPVFDQLALASDNEADAGKRAELMSQAEQISLNDAPFCMSVFLNSNNLVHPDLAGYEDNLEDIHRARWFRVKAAQA
jgi:oligopeptide transport system substrate-binding protein